MTRKEVKPIEQPPILAILDLLGQRWALRILWELRNGARTSRQIRDTIAISPTVLQSRLDTLRKAGVVELIRGQGYRLTDRGLGLVAAFRPMETFATCSADGSDGSLPNLAVKDPAQTIQIPSNVQHPAQPTPGAFAARVLRYFYPVHYRFGMEMEQAMGQGRLGRKQAALLWLIYSEAGPDGWMPRKDIETTLGAWFEMSPPNVTKIIHDTASAPHEMIEIIESPGSGREKLLRLTSEGRIFVSTMIESAGSFLGGRVEHMSQAKLAAGLVFLEEAFGQETNLPV